MLNAIVLHPDEEWAEVDDLEKISELMNVPGNLVWAMGNVNELTSHDMTLIAEEFGLHSLAVEDAINTRQRPKLESYDKHLFAVMHQLDTFEGQLEAVQIACFIGRRWVLTLHAGANRSLAEASRRCFRGKKGSDQGPSFVMHALLDTIVDEYQAIANELEQQVEDLEDAVLNNPLTPVQGQLYSVKQRVSRLRRYSFPGERLLSQMINADTSPLITKRTAAHFRDVHDHLLRIIDQVRNVDDLTDAVIDLQRAEHANEQNITTKRLTGWAAIIAVPTFIASVYGMNFVELPPTKAGWGFWFMLGLMFGASGILYTMFKRRRWI